MYLRKDSSPFHEAILSRSNKHVYIGQICTSLHAFVSSVNGRPQEWT